MFNRIVLKEQVLHVLLESIARGDYSVQLPSERELCRQLGVGRNTLREAVKDLAAQNIVRLGGNGRQHEIVNIPTLPRQQVLSDHIIQNVRYLSSEPFHELGELTSEVYQTLTESFRATGKRLVFECRAGWVRRFNRKEIERLTAIPNTAGWILHRQPKSVQRWFASSGIPTVVTGYVFPGISLPSVSYDIEAQARHAAHQFLRMGHRNIAFVTPAWRTASEQACVDTFHKAVLSYQGAKAILIEHGADVSSINRGLFASRMGRTATTAYFIMAPDHAVTVLTLFLSAGVKIPQEVSLICASGAKIMSAAVPAIAYYKQNPVALGKTAARVLDKCIDGRITVTDHSMDRKILPTLVAGDSVAPPP